MKIKYQSIQQLKFIRVPFLTYANTNLEYLIKKISKCKNNPEKLSTRKQGEHILCGFSISSVFAFDDIVNKRDVYRGKDCMKNLLIVNNFIKLEVIVIIQVAHNILHIRCYIQLVNYFIRYWKKFLQFFTVEQTMILS